MNSLGHHILLDLYSCPPETLETVSGVKEVMDLCAVEAGCHIVQSSYHQFEPHGVSGATIIQESHLTIHTWPEHGYAAVDLFYCGEGLDMERAVSFLVSRFRSGRWSVSEIARGVTDIASAPAGE